MPGIPRRYAHFVFGVIQSGLTTAIASAIASRAFIAQGVFLGHWLGSWGLSWLLMLPIVIIAASPIRRLADRLTTES